MKKLTTYLTTLLIFSPILSDDTIGCKPAKTKKGIKKQPTEKKECPQNKIELKVDALTKQVEELKDIVERQHQEMMKKFDDMSVMAVEE